jgi:hypothetical protein
MHATEANDIAASIMKMQASASLHQLVLVGDSAVFQSAFALL